MAAQGSAKVALQVSVNVADVACFTDGGIFGAAAHVAGCGASDHGHEGEKGEEGEEGTEGGQDEGAQEEEPLSLMPSEGCGLRFAIHDDDDERDFHMGGESLADGWHCWHRDEVPEVENAFCIVRRMNAEVFDKTERVREERRALERLSSDEVIGVINGKGTMLPPVPCFPKLAEVDFQDGIEMVVSKGGVEVPPTPGLPGGGGVRVSPSWGATSDTRRSKEVSRRRS